MGCVMRSAVSKTRPVVPARERSWTEIESKSQRKVARAKRPIARWWRLSAVALAI